MLDVNVSNFSRYSNISSNIINFSTSLLNGLNISNQNYSFGQNILHLACKEGNKEIVFQLLQIFDLKNKDFKILTSKEDQKKWTPIYYAIDVSESGFPDIVGKSNIYKY
jgi:ankyrin repeat protein